MSSPCNTFFTNADIVSLPDPVQRYFRACGYIGSTRRMCARIQWSGVKLRLSPAGKWRNIACHEFLAAAEPLRMVLLRSHIAGLIPFEAKDKYQGGHGNMLIKLAGLFTLQDAKGKEMDESALVTFLSECLLLPSSALQPYIRWSEVTRDCAAATIRFNNTEVKGLFFFNDCGEFIRFETGDRWQAGKHGRFTRTPWMVTASDYIEDLGIRRPRSTSACWLIHGEWWEYFKGEITAIT